MPQLRKLSAPSRWRPAARVSDISNTHSSTRPRSPSTTCGSLLRCAESSCARTSSMMRSRGPVRTTAKSSRTARLRGRCWRADKSTELLDQLGLEHFLANLPVHYADVVRLRALARRDDALHRGFLEVNAGVVVAGVAGLHL